MSQTTSRLVLLAACALSITGVASAERAATEKASDLGRLTIATTTSTDNSGLMSELLPEFTKRTGVEVDVIAVGTGRALELGRNGDVDVLLVHDPLREEEFVANGFGVNRRSVMYNDFVILGPPDDPAGVSGLPDAALAFDEIRRSGERFVSRGDDSGTHSKERALWREIGTAPSGAWYLDTGHGMSGALMMASELHAYILCDRGTWLSMQSKLDLEVVVEGDPRLFNPYGVVAVNPVRHQHVRYVEAMLFIGWITSQAGQTRIGEFSVGGETLFVPAGL